MGVAGIHSPPHHAEAVSSTRCGEGLGWGESPTLMFCNPPLPVPPHEGEGTLEALHDTELRHVCDIEVEVGPSATWAPTPMGGGVSSRSWAGRVTGPRAHARSAGGPDCSTCAATACWSWKRANSRSAPATVRDRRHQPWPGAGDAKTWSACRAARRRSGARLFPHCADLRGPPPSPTTGSPQRLLAHLPRACRTRCRSGVFEVL